MPKTNNAWTIDQRPQVVPAAPELKPQALFTTDGGPSYPKWLKASQLNVVHDIKHSPIGNTDFDPLFGINVTFAKMRNDLARLGRKTWTTTKSIQGLRNHLWLYVAWTNGYQLK